MPTPNTCYSYKTQYFLKMYNISQGTLSFWGTLKIIFTGEMERKLPKQSQDLWANTETTYASTT
jgi:hypothetical protein